MRKKMIALILCISTVAALSGCGNSKSSTGDTDSAENLVKLGDYKNLKVEVDKSYKITDNSVKETIENYFLSAPIYTENKEKDTVADGDVANIDYEGTKDGKAFDGGSAEGYNLKIGSGTFIDGFESGLVGKKVGETVELNLTFPEDYGSDELAGKDVVFKVTINSIQDESYPTYDTLTDEYVKDNYNDYYGVSTVKELEEYITESLESNHSAAVGDALTEKLKDISKISDIPDSLITERTKELKSYYKGMAKYQDQEFEDFLQNTYGMSEEDFDKQIKELMPDYVKSDLVWEAVAAKEGIKASGDKYDTFLEKMMSSLNFDKKDDLFDVYPETMVKRMYIEQEAKEQLTEQAKVKYVETTSEDDSEQTQSDGSEDTDTSENEEIKDTIDTTTGK